MDPSIGAVKKKLRHTTNFVTKSRVFMGPAIVDGIATRYGMDGLGIEYRWGRGFPHASRAAFGPTQSPVQWVSDLFTGRGGGQAAGAWR